MSKGSRIPIIQAKPGLADLHYIAVVDAMIPKAMEISTKKAMEIPTRDLNPVIKGVGNTTFKSCTRSRLFHLEMNRMKREAGLIK